MTEKEQAVQAALISARDVLRHIAANRKNHGPIATKALSVIHEINNALDMDDGSALKQGEPK